MLYVTVVRVRHVLVAVYAAAEGMKWHRQLPTVNARKCQDYVGAQPDALLKQHLFLAKLMFCIHFFRITGSRIYQVTLTMLARLCVCHVIVR